MMRVIPVIVLLALCAATVLEITSPPTPRFLYNKSDSAPVGWYSLDPNGARLRDTRVAAFAPPEARKLAHERGYLPDHVPLIKTVWAVEGDQICSNNGVITAPNRPDIYAAVQDGLGRRLPQIEGCFTLQAGEAFLISTDVQTSWDSRYFGAVSSTDILGTVRYLGNHQDKLVRLGGWARGFGADGKIKGNSAPWPLSHCLHIFFGGTPFQRGSAPIWTETPMGIGFTGGAPYPESHARSRYLA